MLAQDFHLGTRQFWRVLADGGLISKKTAYNLPLPLRWRGIHTAQIQKELIRNKLFLTDIVKCCYGHSRNPDKKIIQAHQPYLIQEIKILKPKKIVAFGRLVTNILTGENIHLAEYWSNSRSRFKLRETLSGFDFPVVPVYFPTGRGNPNKAARLLRLLIKK